MAADILASSPDIRFADSFESIDSLVAGDEKTCILLALGNALHRAGAPAHRLEAILAELAETLDYPGAFFSTPTAIFASFGQGNKTHTHLLRVEPAGIDLVKQASLDELVDKLLCQSISLKDAKDRLTEIETSKPLYGQFLRTLSFGLTSSAVAVFLQGGWADVLLSGLIGLVVGIIAWLASRYAAISRLFEISSAMIATFIASSAAFVFSGQFATSIFVNILAGVIVLVPGLTLTVAITELSTQNLASGTARLMSAAMTFVQLGFGVVAGMTLSKALFAGTIPMDTKHLQAAAFSYWSFLPAIVFAAFSLQVLFHARIKDFPWVLLAVAVAVFSAKFSTQYWGGEVGAFLGALIVASLSNLRARLLNQPAAVTLLPGVILLVPGSVGFRSVASFLQADVLGGISTGFSMFMIATSLAVGLLVANAAVKPRRVL